MKRSKRRRMDRVVRIANEVALKFGLRLLNCRMDWEIEGGISKKNREMPHPFRFITEMTSPNTDRMVSASGVEMGYASIRVDVQILRGECEYRVEVAPTLNGQHDLSPFVEDWHVSEDEIETVIRRGLKKSKRWMGW